MPQMVALYNGVGGGAAALIAWSEFRHDLALGGGDPARRLHPDPVLDGGRLGLLLGLEHRLREAPGADLRPADQDPGAADPQRRCCWPGSSPAASCSALDHDSGPSQALFIAVLIAAAILGNLFVLPIGGADMPVVISLLNAFTGLSAAAAGFALDNVVLIVAGTLVGSSGTILTIAMATAMNRSIGNLLFAGFGAVADGRRRRGRGAARARRSARRTRRSSSPMPTRSSSSPATGWRSPRPSTPSRRWPTSSRSSGVSVELRDPPGRRADARAHERAARRGRRPLRAAQGDGRDQPGDAADRRRGRDRGQRRHQPGGQGRPRLSRSPGCRSSRSTRPTR